MTYCGTCGNPLTTEFCPDDGWSVGTAPGPSQKAKSHDGPINMTAGANSPIYYGTADQVSPVPMRTKSRSFVRVAWLRVAAVLTMVGTVCSITGITFKDFEFKGLIESYAGVFTSGQTALAVIPALMLFLACMLSLVSIIALLGGLGFKKYVMSYGGAIWENRAGRLTRTKLKAECPICHTRTLTLRRITVRTESYKTTNAKGEKVDKERAVREPRLICSRNPSDHIFKFDPALLIDT